MDKINRLADMPVPQAHWHLNRITLELPEQHAVRDRVGKSQLLTERFTSFLPGHNHRPSSVVNKMESLGDGRESKQEWELPILVQMELLENALRVPPCGLIPIVETEIVLDRVERQWILMKWEHLTRTVGCVREVPFRLLLLGTEDEGSPCFPCAVSVAPPGSLRDGIHAGQGTIDGRENQYPRRIRLAGSK